jgi:hypothetical protein
VYLQSGCLSYTTVTEATYPPPKKNHTSPAPKSTAGLGSDLGEIQQLDPTYSKKNFKRIEEARDYMHNVVMKRDSLMFATYARTGIQVVHSGLFWGSA